ncbi:MAG: nuclear transport factor 2 family protein [Myxococcales bacterium]|nr:nuclear transport factor 2 family protein [Myxococcales bacterium]
MTDDAAAARSHRCLIGYFDALRSLDPERIAQKFADDGEIEDPVGGPVHRGRQAIAEYFAAGMCAAASRVEIEIITALPAGSSIAAHWRMTAHAKKGHEVVAEGIDVLEVDGSGSIRRAEGYWDLWAFRAALARS